MNQIVSLNPSRPGSYAPLLAGALEGAGPGTPLLLGYEAEGAARAALAAVCQERSITLRWVSVDGPFRRQGIAAEMVDTLCRLGQEAGAEWVDAVVCLPEGQLAAAKALLLSQGFRLADQSPVFSLRLSSVLNGPLASRIQAAPHSRAATISSLPGYLLREFNADMLRQEGFSPIQPEQLLADCSFAWVEKDRIIGCALTAPCGEDVEMRWLYGHKPLALQELLAAAAAALAAQRGPETRIQVAALQPNIESLIRRLAGGELTTEPPVLSFRRELR